MIPTSIEYLKLESVREQLLEFGFPLITSALTGTTHRDPLGLDPPESRPFDGLYNGGSISHELVKCMARW